MATASPESHYRDGSTTALLLSMTGFGEARSQREGLAVAVEVRTVNSRFFKLSVRTGDGYGTLEPRVEAVVRKRIRRGTVQVGVRVDRVRSPEDYRINVGLKMKMGML